MTASSSRRAGWLAAPFLAGSILVLVLPLVGAFALAFTDHSGFGEPSFVGLDNLERMVGDHRWWASVRTTLLFLAVVVPIRLAAATGLALLLHRRTRPAVAGRTTAFGPDVIPDAAAALVWIWLLNPIYGPLGAGLAELGLPTDQLLTEPWGTRTSIAVMSIVQIGEGFLVALVWRSSLGRSQYEAAALAGATGWQTLWRLTLPQMAPILVVLAVRDAVVALQAGFTANLLVTLGGPRGTSAVVPYYLYQQAFDRFRLGYASMLGVMVLLVSLLAAAVAVTAARRAAVITRLRGPAPR